MSDDPRFPDRGGPFPSAEPTRETPTPQPPRQETAGHRRVAPARHGGRTWEQAVVGVLLLAAGVLWLLDAGDVTDVAWRMLLPVALALVGAAVLALSIWRTAGSLIGIGVVLTVLVLASAVAPARISARVGDQVERPTTLEQTVDGYAHGMGTLTVDLRELPIDRPVTIEASVGMGELVVRVPSGQTVEVEANVGMGDINALGRTSSGIAPRLDERFTGDEGPTLRLELSVGMGQIRVER
jgi:hypothetical protein